MTKSSLAGFLIIVLSLWALMHAYAFWRAASVPWVAAHATRRGLVIMAVGLWASYPLARILNAHHLQTLGVPLEYLATTWIGTLFLIVAALLVTDVGTLGGLLCPRRMPAFTAGSLVVALALAALALVQGLRPPVIRNEEVRLPGLPRARDGLTLVALSDMHLGTLLGERWMSRLIDRVQQLRPDLVVIVGDLVDGNVDHVETLVPALKRLQAPLGVWSVTGNHEYYAGVERSVGLLDAAGYTVLRNRSVEVTPGLVLAGVDDLTANRQFGFNDRSLERALSNRPAGAVILLSHTPWETERAAALGAGLMLSGHTHNGQIWPFAYLSRLRYPLITGRHEVAGMTLIVGKGAGTWGPRMRLWGRGEILCIKLRSAG
jgi:uncharacterized protein